MKQCQICKADKSESEFGNNKTKFDGLQSYCKSCSRAKDKKCYSTNPDRARKIRDRERSTRVSNRQWLMTLLVGKSCIDCGMSNVVCLDYDHVRGTKYKSVSRMKGQSQKRILAEIAKCDVRCSNCHRIRHAKENNWIIDL